MGDQAVQREYKRNMGCPTSCVLHFGACPKHGRLATQNIGVRLTQADLNSPLARRECMQRGQTWSRICNAHVLASFCALPRHSWQHARSTPAMSVLPRPSPPPPPPPPPPPSPPPKPDTFNGWLLAATPAEMPIYHPATCAVESPASPIPRILHQTGRGNSISEHISGDMDAAEHRRHMAHLAADGIHARYYNDSAARAFVQRHCPFAAQAFDCLRPPPCARPFLSCVHTFI